MRTRCHWKRSSVPAGRLAGVLQWLFLAVFLMGGFTPQIWAEKHGSTPPLGALEVAQRLQETYDRLTTLQARFSQTTTVPMSSRVRAGRGRLVLKKPGRMRWDYLEPEPQVLVSDGETVKLYLAASRQMMVRKVEEYLKTDVAYRLFAGQGRILDDFLVEEASDKDEGQGTYLLKLTPKTLHPQVDFLYAWVDPEQFVVVRLEIHDQFGSVTTLRFQEIEKDVAVDDRLFSFTPPENTEILTGQ